MQVKLEMDMLKRGMIMEFDMYMYNTIRSTSTYVLVPEVIRADWLLPFPTARCASRWYKNQLEGRLLPNSSSSSSRRKGDERLSQTLIKGKREEEYMRVHETGIGSDSAQKIDRL